MYARVHAARAPGSHGMIAFCLSVAYGTREVLESEGRGDGFRVAMKLWVDSVLSRHKF